MEIWPGRFEFALLIDANSIPGLNNDHFTVAGKLFPYHPRHFFLPFQFRPAFLPSTNQPINQSTARKRQSRHRKPRPTLRISGPRCEIALQFHFPANFIVRNLQRKKKNTASLLSRKSDLYPVQKMEFGATDAVTVDEAGLGYNHCTSDGGPSPNLTPVRRRHCPGQGGAHFVRDFDAGLVGARNRREHFESGRSDTAQSNENHHLHVFSGHGHFWLVNHVDGDSVCAGADGLQIHQLHGRGVSRAFRAAVLERAGREQCAGHCGGDVWAVALDLPSDPGEEHPEPVAGQADHHGGLDHPVCPVPALLLPKGTPFQTKFPLANGFFDCNHDMTLFMRRKSRKIFEIFIKEKNHSRFRQFSGWLHRKEVPCMQTPSMPQKTPLWFNFWLFYVQDLTVNFPNRLD